MTGLRSFDFTMFHVQ